MTNNIVHHSGDEVALSVDASEDEFQSKGEEPNMDRLESLTYGPMDDKAGQKINEISASGQDKEGQGLVMPQLDISRIQNDPAFKELVSKAVAEQMKNEKDKLLTELQKNSPTQKDHNDKNTPVRISAGNVNCNRNREFVKSPSDTTIYTPALQKSKSPVKAAAFMNQDELKMNQISEFVHHIRIEKFPVGEPTSQANVARVDLAAQTGVPQPRTSSMNDQVITEVADDGQEQARAIAQKMIVDAEKYKANLEKPAGTVEHNVAFNPMAMGGKMDDEFFHITCYVDVI